MGGRCWRGAGELDKPWEPNALPEREELFRCDAGNSSALLSRMRPDKHKIFPSPAAARAVKVAADIVTF